MLKILPFGDPDAFYFDIFLENLKNFGMFCVMIILEYIVLFDYFAAV